MSWFKFIENLSQYLHMLQLVHQHMGWELINEAIHQIRLNFTIRTEVNDVRTHKSNCRLYRRLFHDPLFQKYNIFLNYQCSPLNFSWNAPKYIKLLTITSNTTFKFKTTIHYHWKLPIEKVKFSKYFTSDLIIIVFKQSHS